ncbi:MAG TPA: THUMP domain-containing protein [Candidatus Methanomethylophilaceae archaeon]|nr:THUMP domain-containing protein [Candidatus Methanomethylophilaceae archaeon]
MFYVSVIMVRYSEIGLKSTPVRMRFENQLKDAMLSMLAADGVEALVDKGEARYYVRAADNDSAIKSLRKVFGIASLSLAKVTTSSMEDIRRTAAEYSKGRISQGESFAVKPRREGSHPYKSMDVGREAGSAIFVENEHLGVRVDLTNPDKIFYVEVRENKAYIFDEYIRCHGGLPVGCQGRVVAFLGDDRASLSTWLMMKRGCRVIARGKDSADILIHYDPEIKFIDDDEENPRNVLGYVLGTPFENIKEVDVSKYDLPVYFPTIGMTDVKVSEMMELLKKEVK